MFYALLLFLLLAVVVLLPKSFLGEPAKSVLNWLPPFLGGKALRDWAATAAEQLAQKRLAGKRSGETASQLAMEIEEAAMHAMLPLVEPADLKRIVACPETGQGRVGVTAPEALAIADYIRKNKSRAEQKRIYDLAVENAKKIASRKACDGTPHPCALQGGDHVCCVFAQRPLRCRPLHAISVAKEMSRHDAPPAHSPAQAPDEPRHERIVAEGIEAGVTRALKSAGLDANIYELNSALATALENPDAAERWARGEDVFHNALR
ncbi:MAG: hypothetical protein HY043_10865 [Verrucomicrobia bacterium]|nr:hypothetical protein [Verrucomicrobiota bacterium]